jgi:uncharacterized protein YcaQ
MDTQVTGQVMVQARASGPLGAWELVSGAEGNGWWGTQERSDC